MRVVFVVSVMVAWAAGLPSDMKSSRQIIPPFLGMVIESVLPNGLCGCLCGLANKETRSLDNPFKTKVLGGDVPPPHSQPWQILVHNKGKLVAGGAMISFKYALTAASPLSNASAYNVKIQVAQHDRCFGDITSSNMSVEAIEIHPAYSAATRAHDLALLRIASTAKFDDRFHPICMPNIRTNYQGQVATVVSWLEPTPGGEPSCEPRRIKQPILSEEECSRAVTTPKLYTEDKSCIGVVGSKTLICSGDVGSPVQTINSNNRYELVGILTDINVCDATNATLFIKVAEHLTWMSKVMESDCMCRL